MLVMRYVKFTTTRQPSALLYLYHNPECDISVITQDLGVSTCDITGIYPTTLILVN